MKPTVNGLIELARVAVGDDPGQQLDWMERQLSGCNHVGTKRQMELAVAQLRIRAARRTKGAKR